MWRRILKHHDLVFVSIAAFALCALLRLASFGEPPERDLEIYSTIASALLAGQPLYSELLDIKPPGIFLVYAAFQWIVGEGPLAYFLIGTTFAAATGVGLYALINSRSESTMAACVGAALWCWVSIDLHLQANQPNAEVVMNAFLVGGLAVGYSGRASPWRALVAGSLLAFATFTKQALGPEVVLLAGAIACRFPGTAMRVRAFFAVLAPSAVLWAGAWAWFAADGRGELFKHLIIDYPREYATIFGSSMRESLVAGLGSKGLGPTGGRVLIGVSIGSALLALVIAAWRRRWTDAALFGAWTVGTWFTVSAPGHFYAHYFQLWLPLMVFAWSWLLAIALAAAPTLRVAGIAACALAAIAVGYRTPGHLAMSPEAWSRAKYGADFTEYEAFARSAKGMLGPGDRVFVWGVYPSVYRVMEKPSPTGIANVWLTIPSYGGSYASRWTSELIADLERNMPDAVVVDRFTLDFTPDGHAVKELLRTRYRVVAKSGERILLVVRTDSELMQRLARTRQG